MDGKDFRILRLKFEKTQKALAMILGTSLKAIQSFEQGWRKVPMHTERQMLFLAVMKAARSREKRPCWSIRNCPLQVRRACPAWEFNLGHLCWFVNGTLCRGKPQGSWSKKMKICTKCEVFLSSMEEGNYPARKAAKAVPAGAREGRGRTFFARAA